MGFFRGSQLLKATAGYAVVAGVVAPVPGPAQPGSGPAEIDQREQRLVDQIEEAESRDGRDSTDLIGPLSGLGLLYQESGDHVLAVAALEQARQVVRHNYGLYSLEEAPLLRQLIRSEEALGNVAKAWDLEQKLLSLAWQYADDPRTVPVFREIADRRMDVLRQYNEGGYPPQIVLGCYYGGDSCHSGSSRVVRGRLLREAVSYYSRAIDTILQNEGYSSDELKNLLTTLVGVAYAHPGREYLGRKSLRFLYAYEVENAAPRQIQLEALVQVFDWDLMFAEYRQDEKSALEGYEQTYALFEEAGVEQSSIDKVFSPAIPVVLPVFQPNPLRSDESPESTGFIDVAFEINQYGESEHIDVLDTTNASRTAQRDLVRSIKRSRFRPRAVDGEFAEASAVVVRYYVTE